MGRADFDHLDPTVHALNAEKFQNILRATFFQA
jgi:hypothetical protein